MGCVVLACPANIAVADSGFQAFWEVEVDCLLVPIHSAPTGTDTRFVATKSANRLPTSSHCRCNRIDTGGPGLLSRADVAYSGSVRDSPYSSRAC